ncbi:hypothetical protein L1887_05022 [Cichorium endivia]|nr:hypothetical protein L1887_05022 [Cichorium endivia]
MIQHPKGRYSCKQNRQADYSHTIGEDIVEQAQTPSFRQNIDNNESITRSILLPESFELCLRSELGIEMVIYG